MRILSLVLCVAAFSICGALTAFAADGAVPATEVLDVVRPYLVEIASALIVAFVAWLASWLRATFKLELDARHREALHSALANGAALVMQQLDKAAAGTSIPVGNASVAKGVEYVLTYSPEAAAYFGLTPEAIGEMIRAKLAPAAQG